MGKETLGIHIMSIIFNTGGGEEIQTHGWSRSMVSRSFISILTYFVTAFQWPQPMSELGESLNDVSNMLVLHWCSTL